MKTAFILKSKRGLRLVTGQARAQMRHLRPWATPHTGASGENSEGRLLGCGRDVAGRLRLRAAGDGLC